MYLKIQIPEVSSGGAKDTDDDENNHNVERSLTLNHLVYQSNVGELIDDPLNRNSYFGYNDHSGHHNVYGGMGGVSHTGVIGHH